MTPRSPRVARNVLALAAVALAIAAMLAVVRSTPRVAAAPREDRSARTAAALPAPTDGPLAKPGAASARRDQRARREDAAHAAPVTLGRGRDDPGPGSEHMEKYGGRSGRLSPNASPGGANVTTRIASPESAPSLVVWVPSIRVQLGNAAVIHATLTSAGGTELTPDTILARIALAAEGGEIGIPMKRSPGAASFEATFTPDPTTVSNAASNATIGFRYVVYASGTTDGHAYERTAAGAFAFHRPGATVDASSLRAEKSGTDVVLRADATIAREGVYFAYAELWGGPDGDVPIAFARERLGGASVGTRSLSLVFGGAVIHERGVDGPWVVRNVRFQAVDVVPPQEQEPIAVGPTTPAWRAAEMR